MCQNDTSWIGRCWAGSGSLVAYFGQYMTNKREMQSSFSFLLSPPNDSSLLLLFSLLLIHTILAVLPPFQSQYFVVMSADWFPGMSSR